MTYLPENIFKIILSYCGYEEVERRQRQRNKLVLENIEDSELLDFVNIDLKKEFIYKNWINYDLVYSPRYIKSLESFKSTTILNGFIIPNLFDRFGNWKSPIVRLVSVTKCLNLKKKDSLLSKIKFAKSWNRLDCDCCNGVNKAKQNKEIVLCELLKKPIVWRGGSSCITGLCEEIKQRC